MSATSTAFGKRYLAICLVLFFVLLFSGLQISAGPLEDCLLKALKTADNSVTVGQLRAQCEKQEGPVSDGPAEVVLKTSHARKPAFFPHRRHQAIYPCGTCHHGQNESGKIVAYTPETRIQKCTTCHNPDMANVELNGFKAIGHKLCRECHRTHQDLTSAKCSTCHRKNL